MFTKTQRNLGVLLAAALVVGLAGTARAQGPGRAPVGGMPAHVRPQPYRPVTPGLRPPFPRPMPGWDWKYLYPQVYYSTYGYWPYPYYGPVYPYVPARPVNPYYPGPDYPDYPDLPYGSAQP
jgi:hypothetical protein